jgi:epoxyqueuosine reductase
MEWLAETRDRRANPQSLWPEVRSVIMLAMNYGPQTDPLENLAQKSRATISVYARNRDYHDIIKGKLKQLAGKFASRAGGDVKVFVDTAPVMEKPLAQAAGLGWIGKHTNLVSRNHGSWLFLGSIFTTVELPPDAPPRRSLRLMPGLSFSLSDRRVSRALPDRCAALHFLSHHREQGADSHEFRTPMGNRIYGCDDCLAVCPWNKYAQSASEMKLVARDDLQSPRIADFLALDDAGFRAFLLRISNQADRPQQVPAQCVDCGGQQR